MVHLLTSLGSLLPDAKYLDKTAQLTTGATLNYLLLRLQGQVKLFCRIVGPKYSDTGQSHGRVILNPDKLFLICQQYDEIYFATNKVDAFINNN